MNRAVESASRELLAVIGKGDALSYLVSDAINLLLRECIDRESPHEFETVTRIGRDGRPREVKVFPQLWLARLARAAESGAFGRRPVKDIVDIILTTPAPADLVPEELTEVAC